MDNDRKIAWSVVGGASLFWLVVILLFVTSGLYGQEVLRPTGRLGFVAATPTPDPCVDCPDPDSFSCLMWPEICYQCWEDCGRPIATPTPTPLPTRTPTPTPAPGECRFRLLVDPGHPKEVYAIAYYLHESEELGIRYRANPPLVREGDILRAATEGNPVAVEWYARLQGIGEYKVVSTCGVVPPLAIPPTPTPTPSFIFKDGFETGNTDAWSVVTK